MPRSFHLFSLLALVLVVGLAWNCGSSGTVQDTERKPPPIIEGRAPDYRSEGIRIATFNGEFLFDGLDPEGQASFPWKDDPVAARVHQDSVARVIRDLDADVIVIPETENVTVLERMVQGPLAGMGYQPVLIEGEDTFTMQDVGMLSRLPVEMSGRTDERVPVGLTDRTYGVSKNLWARIDLGGTPTTLIGAHFLARPDDKSREDRREAQAEVIRRLVERETRQGREVIALGDFNDFDAQVPDRIGSRPITDVLTIIKSAGPGPEDDLINVMSDVPQADRYTSFYDRNDNGELDAGELSAIDHLLLSPGLYQRLREVRFVHGHDPRLVSDHFPIVVTLGVN